VILESAKSLNKAKKCLNSAVLQLILLLKFYLTKVTKASLSIFGQLVLFYTPCFTVQYRLKLIIWVNF